MDAAAEAFERQKLIRHENLQWLVVAQGIVILPLLFRLPAWLWLLWLGSMVWRFRIHAGKTAYPNPFTKMILAGACLVGLVFSYKGMVGVEPMVGFLVCAFVLKLLELRSRKDGLLLLFIGFIAVAAQFLFAQTIFMAAYACIACVVLITAWHTIYLTRTTSNLKKLKTGGVLLLHAFPLMMVFFVVMPRLGPLWRVPLPQGEAKTGFSDSMAPGDIGNLVKSGGTAFRVTFDGDAPPQSELYWRGIVLDTYDGRRWSLSNNWNALVAKTQNVVSLKNLTDYTIIFEPHQYQWLLALAEPVKVVSSKDPMRITSDGLLSANDPVNTRIQYRVLSASSDKVDWPDLPTYERMRWLQLPHYGNPKAQKLANDWVAKGLTPPDIINKALALYHQQFFYTLSPPVLGPDAIDEFLFVTQKGFCEHFASSFTYLMRSAGIPARVALGYQGGSFNAIENYWRVSQADAHAWSEVWLQGQGWVRVDPTNAVAPNRITQGINNGLSEDERGLVANGEFAAPKWLNILRRRADAAGFAWNRWVLNYNPERQGELLTKLLGGLEPWRLGLAFLCSCGVILGVYLLAVLRLRQQAKTEFERALHQFDKTCKKYGLVRLPNESLSAFALRIPAQVKALEVPALHLAKLAEKALYASDHQYRKALLLALRCFPTLPV